jgi:hypothetical protein
MLTVTSDELQKWADKYSAKAEFPHLIRRLIWATCSEIRKLDFQGDEDIYLSGFDGISDCGQGNHIVPNGLSVWELSTEKDVTSKANDDYDKRTHDPGLIDRSKASFIFATPRRWPKGKDWEVERTVKNDWVEVRALWSGQLAMWMDQVPWVATSFARQCLGKEVTGFRTMEMIWAVYTNVPTRGLEPDFVIGGRDHIRDQLLNWILSDVLSDDERIIRVSGSSEREIFDFVAAGSRILGDSEYTKFVSRVFAVDDIASAQCLRGVTADHTILVTGDVIPYVISLSRRTNCKVVIVHALRNATATPLPHLNAIKLGSIGRTEIIRNMIGFGYSPPEAGRICEQYSFEYEPIRKAIFLC